MTIKERISSSAEFRKLLGIVNTPLKCKRGEYCTCLGTTQDTQRIVLNLLVAQTKQSFIYSTLSSRNCINFLNSLNFYKEISFDNLKKQLNNYNFKRCDKVTSSGKYSVRGDIINFWPSIYDHPIRASFWGTKCESVEIYDEVYQNKISSIKQFALGDESKFEDDIERQSITISSFKFPINKNQILFLTRNPSYTKNYVNFHFSYPTLFFKRIDLLEKEVLKRNRNNWTVEISTIHKDQLSKQLAKFITKEKHTSGFESKRLKIAAYTDREIFGTIFISAERAKNKQKINRYLAQLEGEIALGNYIVHEDYGIALYRGITQKKVLGKTCDYLILEYAEKDKLSVPITQVDKLTKYIGPDTTPPKITRLGKTNWNLLKKKVKKSVTILAHELLRHYAQAELTKSQKFIKHEWEDKFASEFEFEETNDQERAIAEILYDLQSSKPANRLLVGDVGFGKTEVAIRAAFRTVMNGKQVAILCPTTILVSQHYSVFKHRMRHYPIEIATLSRFGSRQKNQEIVEKLNAGKIDIIIGTHRLFSNDVKFAGLGLLIIDEEQKFGVAQKEKIKKIAYNCNVLTMSATPIPRTLSMALSRLRDISIITTPPPNRRSIKTFVNEFNWQKICQAIFKETKRTGQVYFLHNEVRTIESVKNKLENLLPNIRFKVAHGQMHPQTLEKVMREFYEHKFDCLVCTTIIENGIDIRNVNTIIINKASNFGLAQLYQLRGRVGRGSRQAYSYLFYTQKSLFSKSLDKTISGKIPFEKAKARLEAILESQDLGSGFKIASRDLEIRGAGDLLGRKQHGNISAIGLGLFTQMLADEVERIKQCPAGI